jgi:hypothetical protein
VEITYRPFARHDADDLAGFLTGDNWPFHGSAVVGREEVRRWIADGRYDGDENRTFWITAGDDDTAGLAGTVTAPQWDDEPARP